MQEGIKKIAIIFLLFFIGFVPFTIFWNNVLIPVTLGAIWWIAIAYYKRSDVLYLLIGGISGPMTEIIMVRLGAWSYTNPNFLGIPMWLPFAWGLAIFLIVNLVKVLEEMWHG